MWWAVGKQTQYGFKVRRIVSGRLLARSVKEQSEEVRRVFVTVDSTKYRLRKARAAKRHRLALTDPA